MREPTVAAVMLCSPGREAYQSQALSCLERQTYTGDIRLVSIPAIPGVTIGEMRNRANTLAGETDIICHWDDDDWSHPNRIAEQVALLQVSGADCVGYNEMLFWRQANFGLSAALATLARNWRTWCRRHGLAEHECDCGDCIGEAWLYSNPNPRYALGTSLCCWRLAWEARPFQDLQHGEDTEWLKGVRCHAVGSAEHMTCCDTGSRSAGHAHDSDCYSKRQPEPRMIARIHSGNSSSAYDPIEMARHNALPRAERQWSRAAEWDKVCRGAMECV